MENLIFIRQGTTKEWIPLLDDKGNNINSMPCAIKHIRSTDMVNVQLTKESQFPDQDSIWDNF